MLNFNDNQLINYGKIGEKYYQVPTDVAGLFRTEEDLESFFDFFAKYYIETCKEKTMFEEDYLFPMILSESHHIYNIEYSYLIRVIADWVGGENGDLFIRDFSLNIGDTDYENQTFLIVSLFEHFWKIAGVNKYSIKPSRKNSIPIWLNFYRFVIYSNGNRAVQYSATAFTQRALSKFIDDDLLQKVNEYASDPEVKQRAFGSKQCEKWWRDQDRRRELNTYC